MNLSQTIARFISFSKIAIRVALVISAAALLLSSCLFIVYGSDPTEMNVAMIVFSAIIVSFWTIVYAIIVLSIIYIYNRIRKIASWEFIKTELIILSITILSSVLFILTVAFFK